MKEKPCQFNFFVGADHIFIQHKKTRKFFACGKNDVGQLGLGDEKNRSKFTMLPIEYPIPFVKKISCRFANHSLFLTHNGRVFGCGSNKFGELASTQCLKRSKIEQIKFFEGKKVKNIYAIANASFFQLENGKIYCSGKNEYGELGIRKNLRMFFIPQELDLSFLENKEEKIIDIQGVGKNTAFLTDFGNVYTTKYYSPFFQHQVQTQFDQVTIVNYFKKYKIKIIQISTAVDRTEFLSSEGRAYSCGPVFPNHTLNGLAIFQECKNVKKIECGERVCFFMKTNKIMLGMGNNKNYQLTLWKGNIKCPARVSDHTSKRKFQFIDAFCTRNTSFLVNKDGEVFCCGKNEFGESSLGHSKKVKKVIRIILPLEKKVCAFCGSESQNNMVCSVCRSIFYCNKECQKKHWEVHKKTCKSDFKYVII